MRTALLALSMLQALQPVPGQTTGASGNGSRKIQQKGNTTKQTPAPSVPIQIQIAAPKENGKGTQGQSENPQYSVDFASLPPVTIVEKEKTWKDHLFDWGPWVFNALLVLVGGIGLILAHRTVLAIKMQAKIMRRQAVIMGRQTRLQARSIDLQERQMQQWVKYGKWQSWIVPNEGYKTNGWPSAHLSIKMEIENTTAFPLTLPDARISLVWGTIAKRRCELRSNTILLPNTPQIIDFGGWPLTAEQAERFYAYGVDLRVEGDLPHVGALGKLVPQTFRGQLTCRPSGTTFQEETIQTTEQAESPN